MDLKPITKPLARTKNFLVEHKDGIKNAAIIATTATAAISIALCRTYQQFIDEKGLQDEFYAWGDYETENV